MENQTAPSQPTYHFLKSLDGRYLQATLDTGKGVWRFWLDAQRAWAPCCPTAERAEQYRAEAERAVGSLVIVEETL